MNEELTARLTLCKSFISTSLPYTMRGLISKEGNGEIIFTLHTQEHSQKVQEKLERIIEICNNSSNACKIGEISEFLLYCSAWLHDVGCIISRDDHGRLSAKIISENRDLLQGIKGYEQFIGMICGTHTYKRNKNKDPILKLPEKILEESGEFIRPKYLASIFRLADACDLDRRKAPILVHRLLSKYMTNESKKYWEAHSNVYSCGFDKNKILITFFDKKEYDEFIFKELKKQFDEVKSILFANDFPLKKIEYDYIDPKENWRNYLFED